MVFNYKEGKVQEDGSLSDGTNTIAVGSKQYFLAKARIVAGGTFARKVKTTQDYKNEISKRQRGSYKWVKGVMGVNGLNIDKSGYSALMEEIVNGNALTKYTDVMKKYNKKTLTKNIVDVSNGIETEFTKRTLDREAGIEARATARAEAKSIKDAEKLARAEKTLAERTAKENKRKTDKLMKLELAQAKIDAQKKELMK